MEENRKNYHQEQDIEKRVTSEKRQSKEASQAGSAILKCREFEK